MAFLTFGPDEVLVDIARGCMPFEQEVLDRSTAVTEGGCVFRVPTPEDLIILKAIASRPQDLLDISTISKVNRELDRARIRHWPTQYGELLDEPDLWDRIEPLLNIEY